MKTKLFLILLTLAPVSIPAQLVLTNIYDIPDTAYSVRMDLTNVIIPDTVTNLGNWAFSGCTNLTNIVVGKGVTTIGHQAMATMNRAPFDYPLTNAVSVWFNGDAPTNVEPHAFDGIVWLSSTDIPYIPCNVTVYARPGTKGWPMRGEATLAGRPVWYAETHVYTRTGPPTWIHFDVWGNTNLLGLPVVVRATDDLVNWYPISTNMMFEPGSQIYADCLAMFAEPATNAARFYRVRMGTIDWP